MWTFADTILGDFTVTFYRAAEYMLRGENVYFGKYPNPLNGRDYPPYSPIWVVYPSIPFTALPLDAFGRCSVCGIVGVSTLAFDYGLYGELFHTGLLGYPSVLLGSASGECVDDCGGHFLHDDQAACCPSDHLGDGHLRLA